MTDPFLFWLLAFALFYLLITTLILIRNRFSLTGLIRPESNSETGRKISVCIPARNEESNLPPLLDSLLRQNYSNYSILVLNDSSEDNTQEVLENYRDQHPERIILLQGKPKPDNWLGKPWACQQLADAAEGDILLFLDADTTVRPDMLIATNHSFEKFGLDMLTVWPRQIVKTFWEKTIIPLIYHALVTALPAIYVYRKPRWMPRFIHSTQAEKFAAANGQCIAFTRECYDAIGGHRSVKRQIVEDVELAKRVKRKGFTIRMFHGVGSVECRMYKSHKELFSGLRKNFLAGFGNSLPLFILAAIIHLIVFLLPWPALIYGYLTFNNPILFFSISAITITLLHRLVLASWFRWDPLFAFTHPVGVIWFQALGLVKIGDLLTGRKIPWKGRKV